MLLLETLGVLEELGALNELLETVPPPGGVPLPHPARSKAQQAEIKGIFENFVRLVFIIIESAIMSVWSTRFSIVCRPVTLQ